MFQLPKFSPHSVRNNTFPTISKSDSKWRIHFLSCPTKQVYFSLKSTFLYYSICCLLLCLIFFSRKKFWGDSNSYSSLGQRLWPQSKNTFVFGTLCSASTQAFTAMVDGNKTRLWERPFLWTTSYLFSFEKLCVCILVCRYLHMRKLEEDIQCTSLFCACPFGSEILHSGYFPGLASLYLTLVSALFLLLLIIRYNNFFGFFSRLPSLSFIYLFSLHPDHRSQITAQFPPLVPLAPSCHTSSILLAFPSL